MLPLLLVSLLVCFFILMLTSRTLAISNFSIFIGLWIVLVALYHLNLAGFDPLGLELQFYLTVFFCLYTLIYYCTTVSLRAKNVSIKGQVRRTDWFRKRNRRFMVAFFLLWFLMFAMFVWSVGVELMILLILQGGARASLSAAENVNIWFYLFGYLFILSAAYHGAPRKLMWRALWYLACALVLMSMLLTAAKINFVSAVLLCYIVWYNKEPRLRILLVKHAAFAIVGLYTFIFLYSVYTGKVIDPNVGSAEGLSDILKFGAKAFLYPYDYLTGSLAALNEVFSNTLQHRYAPGSQSFYSVYKIVEQFGLLPADVELPPQFYSFVDVGNVYTNVYTLFYDLWLDFGQIASLAMAIGIGALHAFLDQSEVKGASPPLYYFSEISKLSAFLSFVNFRYGDTIVVLSLALITLSICWRAIVKTPRRVRAKTIAICAA